MKGAHPEFRAQTGAQIRRLREARGLSRAELARRAQLTAGQVGKVEKATSDPALSTLTRIAAGLQVDLSALFPDEDRRMPSGIALEAGLLFDRVSPELADALRAVLRVFRSQAQRAKTKAKRSKGGTK